MAKFGVGEKTVKILADLIRKYGVKEQSVFDAQIVAVMVENEIKEIFTANDKDFSMFQEITVVNPFKS